MYKTNSVNGAPILVCSACGGEWFKANACCECGTPLTPEDIQEYEEACERLQERIGG